MLLVVPKAENVGVWSLVSIMIILPEQNASATMTSEPPADDIPERKGIDP